MRHNIYVLAKLHLKQKFFNILIDKLILKLFVLR